MGIPQHSTAINKRTTHYHTHTHTAKTKTASHAGYLKMHYKMPPDPKEKLFTLTTFIRPHHPQIPFPHPHHVTLAHAHEPDKDTYTPHSPNYSPP